MRRLQIKFPSQIRISGWDFGSSARAMNQAGGKDALMTYLRVIFTQAESGKCPGSTFERKTMSSTIKRIALVAVAALGLGTLTGVSANAAITYSVDTPFSVIVADSGITGANDTVTATLKAGQVAGANNYVRIVAGSDLASGATLKVSTSGANSTLASDPDGSTGASYSDNSSTGIKATEVYSSSNDIYTSASARAGVKIYTPTVGTVTVTIAKNVLNTTTGQNTVTTLQTLTINVVAAGVSGTVDAANSAALMKAAATYSTVTSDDTVVALKTASTTAKAAIEVALAQSSGAIATTTAVTASISGAGSISLSQNANGSTPIATGRSLSSTVASTGETFYVHVFSDGNSGTGTVTITAGGFTSTKTVTFYGAVATLTATVKKSVVANSGSSTTGAIAVVAKDASGVVVPSQSLTITSSDSTIASASGTSASATEAADGTATIEVTGASTKYGVVTLTIKYSDTVSTTASVTVASVKASALKLSFDKDEYAPGELVTLTISGTDANGLPVADGTATSVLTGALASSAAVTSSLQFNSTTATSVDFKAGKSSVKFYAPLVAGTLNVSGTVGLAGTYVATGIASTTLSASVNVVASASTTDAIDAANEATDAANAATDAANAAAEAADAATAAAQDAQAAVAALATQVASLIAGIKAQITTLTNLVIKIQKKVKA